MRAMRLAFTANRELTFHLLRLHMKTFTFIIAIVCMALSPFSTLRAADPAKPNIILCMTDDQGWGDTGYNGLKKIQTPALDAMAANGLRFNRFYAQHPSCSPTRASVMTGRHPYRMGCFWPGMTLRQPEMTIAQAVKRAGYSTAHYGKWHLSGGKPGGGRPLPADEPLGPGKFGFDEWFTVSNWFDLDWTFSHNGTPVKVTGDGSDAIVAEALKFIEKNAKEDKPFLTVIWFGSPHVPLKPTEADLKAAGGSAFYGEMIGVDRSMGTLRAGLRKLGIAVNTMIWFNSDNGAWMEDKAEPDAYGSNSTLHGHKGELWEGGIRVPGIIEWPAGIKKPAVTDMIACTSDIYPTIVELLKIKIADQILPLDGVSLMPLIKGEMKERPQPLGFWHHGSDDLETGPAVWMENRYKLIKKESEAIEPKTEDAQGQKKQKPKRAPAKYELYDLIADPSEKTDIAAQHSEDMKRMQAQMDKWLESVRRSNAGADYPGGSFPKVIEK